MIYILKIKIHINVVVYRYVVNYSPHWFFPCFFLILSRNISLETLLGEAAKRNGLPSRTVQPSSWHVTPLPSQKQLCTWDALQFCSPSLRPFLNCCSVGGAKSCHYLILKSVFRSVKEMRNSPEWPGSQTHGPTWSKQQAPPKCKHLHCAAAALSKGSWQTLVHWFMANFENPPKVRKPINHSQVQKTMTMKNPMVKMNEHEMMD